MIFTTDTMHPVLSGEEKEELEIIMKMIPKRSVKTQASPFSNFPIHFLGLLPGANCKSQYQLDLFSDHTYFIRKRCIKEGSESIESDDTGHWHFNAAKKQLILKGERGTPLLFSVLDADTIEKLDRSGKKIISKLNYKLRSSQTAQK